WGVAESGLGFCDVIFGWDSGDALYDNASVTGWHTGYPDAHATVDLSTYRRIPWEEATAAFLLDFEMPVSPRGVLQKVEQKARAMGFSVKCASEYEFFLFKSAVREMWARHCVRPCFMAKWNKELRGCSGHLHESLWTASGESAFLDQRGPRGMSKTLQHFVAGQVALMPAFTALIAPTINSYKRMVRGAWSPTMATWGVDNRTTALRVIPGSPSAIRVEYRLAAADMNPYIAMAASVASGLYGIEHELPLPVEPEGNGYDEQVEPL